MTSLPNQTLPVLQAPSYTMNDVWYRALLNVAAVAGGAGGAAGGDLSGSYPNPIVSSINGHTLGSTAVTSGNVMIADGSQWNSQNITGVLTLTSSGSTSLTNSGVTAGTYSVNGSGMFAVGADGRLTSANNVIVTAAPSGSAGGDLSGTYPNPTVTQIQGIAVNSTNATAVSNLTGTNTGDQTITLTSDVTGSGTGSFPTTISANAVTTAKINNLAVTYAKIQNVTNARLLGNNAGSAHSIQEITLGTNLSFSGTTLNATGSVPWVTDMAIYTYCGAV